MKRFFIVIYAALLVSGCAAKTSQVAGSNILELFEPKSVGSTPPTDFEQHIPESALLLQSLIIFEKTYPRIYSDDNVSNVGGSDRLISVLKHNEVSFTMPSCSALLTGGHYSHLSVTDYTVLVYNSQSIQLYSAYDCVKYAEYSRTLRGSVHYIKGYVVEVEGQRAALRNATTGTILYDGNQGFNVASVGMVADKPCVVLSNGYLMLYDIEKRLFTFAGQFPITFSELRYADSQFYGIDRKDNTFFIMTDNGTLRYPYTDCVLSSNSPYAMCGDKLVGKNGTYNNVNIGNAMFTVGVEMFATLSNAILHIYTLELSWERFLSFDYTLPRACVYNDTLYFRGFSGGIYSVKDNIENIVQELPKACDYSAILLSQGEFICNGSDCGAFAEVIREDETIVMLKRVEDDKIYYFFEQK